MLKISGEALSGAQGFGIDPAVVKAVAREVAACAAQGVQIALVVGGGNYVRGAQMHDDLDIDRASADYMGMLATVMNALTLQAALETLGVPTRVQTSIEMKEIAEPYIRRRAVRHLERGRVVIFGGGTGNPFFTTDPASALRAAEIDADVFLKATKVDGVYESDPLANPDAVKYSRLSYDEVEANKLGVMDRTAITLCHENDIPVLVFNLSVEGNFTRAMRGEVGTLISMDAGEGGGQAAAG